VLVEVDNALEKYLPYPYLLSRISEDYLSAIAWRILDFSFPFKIFAGQHRVVLQHPKPDSKIS
jgi:hypothetical protein